MHCSSFQSISRKMFTRIIARAVWFKISIGPGNIFGHLAPVRKINFYKVSTSKKNKFVHSKLHYQLTASEN